jgi:hypothetical protein
VRPCSHCGSPEQLTADVAAAALAVVLGQSVMSSVPNNPARWLGLHDADDARSVRRARSSAAIGVVSRGLGPRRLWEYRSSTSSSAIQKSALAVLSHRPAHARTAWARCNRIHGTAHDCRRSRRSILVERAALVHLCVAFGDGQTCHWRSQCEQRGYSAEPNRPGADGSPPAI